MDRLALVERLTRALGEEIDRHDPADPVAWPTLPDVRSMVQHVGVVHRWATEILRSGRHVPAPVLTAPAEGLRDWYEAGRTALVAALREVPADSPCWVIGAGSGTAAFWSRRMVFENVKHLIDLRAAGGRPFEAAAELGPAEYADGVDELLAVMLPRTRAALPPLPAPVRLVAEDAGRSWTLGVHWWPADATTAAAHLRAPASSIALLLWERADAFDASGRFAVEGDEAAVRALQSAPIHPW